MYFALEHLPYFIAYSYSRDPRVGELLGKGEPLGVSLEIGDGDPWYLSPNINIFEQFDEKEVSEPQAGEFYRLRAHVSNNGSSSALSAKVNFYWAQPGTTITRGSTHTPGAQVIKGTAYLVGTKTFDIDPHTSNQEVECEQYWQPTYVADGHECLLAEAFHDEDRLPSGLIISAAGDRHSAQRNVVVKKAFNGLFHLIFECHNPYQEERSFTIKAEQGKLEQLGAFDKLFDDIIALEEGRFEVLGFTQARCPSRDNLDNLEPQLDEVSMGPYGRTGFTLAGLLEGEAAVVLITQLDGRDEIGGLGVVVHQVEENTPEQ